MVHAGTASHEEATDGRVVPGGCHELDATLADEQRRCLDALIDDRLAFLEARPEESLVRCDRLVEIGHGDAKGRGGAPAAMLSAQVSRASGVHARSRSSPRSGTRAR